MRALFRFRLLTLLLMVLVASGFVWLNTRSKLKSMESVDRRRGNWWLIDYTFGWPLTFHEDQYAIEIYRTINEEHFKPTFYGRNVVVRPEFISQYEQPMEFDSELGEWKPWHLAGNILILLLSTLAIGMLFEWLFRRRDRAKSLPQAGA